MTKRDLVSLAMKLIGVFYLVQVVPLVFSLLLPGDYTNRSSSFVLGGGILAVGLLLVFGGSDIAGFIIPQKENSTVSSALSVSDWQAIFFSVLGVYTFIQALRSISTFFYYPKFNMQVQSLVSGSVMLVIGILLFIQARGLANLWRFIQEHRANENHEDENS
ncbi:MAG: hypothetical protein ACYC9O_00820 [Candidatus Latescibacterota bacterium]